jgi:hypothetical protein
VVAPREVVPSWGSALAGGRGIALRAGGARGRGLRGGHSCQGGER